MLSFDNSLQPLALNSLGQAIAGRIRSAERTSAVRFRSQGGEIASHLFGTFQSTKRDGIALGLMICRSTVEAHAGILSYAPNPTGGAIFPAHVTGRSYEEQADQGKQLSR